MEEEDFENLVVALGLPLCLRRWEVAYAGWVGEVASYSFREGGDEVYAGWLR